MQHCTAASTSWPLLAIHGGGRRLNQLYRPRRLHASRPLADAAREEGAHARATLLGQAAVHSNLVHVNLSSTSLGATGGKRYSKRSSRRKSSSRSISFNWLGDVLGDHLIARLNQLLRQAKKLRVLHLRWNDIPSTAWNVLGRSIASTKTLEVLDLGGNYLRNKGAVRSRTPCAATPGLRTLRLDHTGTGSAGAQAFAAVLRNKSTALAHLDLSGNEIADGGAIMLAGALKWPKTRLNF